MSAGERLLARLTASGAVLQVKGDRLHVDAPKGLVTAQLKAEIASHKAEILELLAGQTTEAAPVQPCYACKEVAWWQRPPEIGGGFVCAVCHPDPIRPVLEAAVPPLEGERKALFELAQSRGFPKLSFKAAHSVIGRAESWDVFSRRASDSDVRAARKALQAQAESP